MAGWLENLLRRLFGRSQSRKPAPAPGDPRRTHSGSNPSIEKVPTKAARSTEAKSPPPTRGHFDLLGHSTEHAGEIKTEFLTRLERRISIGDFELPHLPSTHLSLIELTSHPSADIREIAKLVAADPALSSELLKTANSALYAGAMEVDSIEDSVMRMGLRTVRRLLLALSMKDVIFRAGDLNHYAEEVWRQAYAAGSIARAIGPHLGFEADHAYMLGLLHDIGKLALLDMLRKEAKLGLVVDDRIVGLVFQRHHERAGAALATKWKLSEEIIAVAGCHQSFGANTKHLRSAALASLSHKLDLHSSIGDELGFDALSESAEMKALDPEARVRGKVLEAAVEASSQVELELALT